MIPRLAVVGLGLLGGSVAKAARARNAARQIVAVVRDPARLRPAVADAVLDLLTDDLGDGVRAADLVVLAAPVLAIEALVPMVARAAGGETLVTDVGSVKARIVLAAEHASLRFVGSHPMAGSERSGYGASRAELFEGATVIVTPREATDVATVKEVAAFWETLGARVSLLDPETHDRVVAAISHLPHVVAAALVEGARRCDPSALDFAARGFKDTTRIAAGDARLWQEVIRSNRDAVLASLQRFGAVMADVERLIQRDDPAALEAWLAASATVRTNLT